MPETPVPPSTLRRFRFVLVVAWVAFGLVVLPLTAVGAWVKTGKFDLINQLIWESGWMAWGLVSQVVVSLCLRYPIGRPRLGRSVARLALLGIGVVALQLLLDFLINGALGFLLRGYPFRSLHLLHISAYKAHAYYAVYLLIVGATHALLYHQRFLQSELVSSQLEAKLAGAELDRLKSQLQPHFLFNTHHAIVGLILKGEHASAIRMLTQLSDLLRLSLSRSGAQTVPLQEELETLGLYLEIQRERFRDRLTVAISVPDELVQARVPHLLLQPLVENALDHGLADTTEGGRLEIAVRQEGSTLVCTVRDNGAGIPDNAAPAAGIGLSNTRERLQQLYGEAQALELRPAPGGGCTATVRIPYTPLVLGGAAGRAA